MVFASVRDQLRRLRGDDRGAVSVIMGLLIIPFMGFLALGFEVSNWYLITRGMQNAADASVPQSTTAPITRPRQTRWRRCMASSTAPITSASR